MYNYITIIILYSIEVNFNAFQYNRVIFSFLERNYHFSVSPSLVNSVDFQSRQVSKKEESFLGDEDDRVVSPRAKLFRTTLLPPEKLVLWMRCKNFISKVYYPTRARDERAITR